MYKALVLDKHDQKVTSSIREVEEDDLPDGDVLVRVHYSSLNYKDALAVTGRGKVVRGTYPFVPGIDLVGTVSASTSQTYHTGETVIATGWGLGENTWGGYSQIEKVRSEWLVPLPEGMTSFEAMAFGTAGLTAMLSILSLEGHGVQPDQGEVVVTGASGGVGSLAVALLATRGYQVVASTGSEHAHDYLRYLGASRIIHRDELGKGTKHPLQSSRWAGAIDTVGGQTLSSILASLQRHASVAVCGNASGPELHTTVFPFILRGVNMLGIDSNTAVQQVRVQAWQTLAESLPKEVIATITSEIPLSDVPVKCEEILRGDVTGRIVVNVQT